MNFLTRTLIFIRYRLNMLHTNLRTDYKSNQISHKNNPNTKPMPVLEIFPMIFPQMNFKVFISILIKLLTG